jgi:GNAT superfamily N-acetyltransferase
MSGRGICIRRARKKDIGPLRALHRASLRVLGAAHYASDEIEGLFATTETVDPRIVEDGTFLVAGKAGRTVGSGAWTLRRPDHEARMGTFTLPAPGDVATIRAIFTAPDRARQRVARAVMDLVDSEAVLLGGASALELVSTLADVEFYRALGHAPGGAADLPLVGGGTFRGVRMMKEILPCALAA